MECLPQGYLSSTRIIPILLGLNFESITLDLSSEEKKKASRYPFQESEGDSNLMVPGTGIEPAREFPRRSKHRMSTIPSTRRLFFSCNRKFSFLIALNAVRILVRTVFPSAGKGLEPSGFSLPIIRLCPACGPALRTISGEKIRFFASSAGVYVRNLPEFVDNYGRFRQVIFLGYLVPKSYVSTSSTTSAEQKKRSIVLLRHLFLRILLRIALYIVGRDSGDRNRKQNQKKNDTADDQKRKRDFSLSFSSRIVVDQSDGEQSGR